MPGPDAQTSPPLPPTPPPASSKPPGKGALTPPGVRWTRWLLWLAAPVLALHLGLLTQLAAWVEDTNSRLGWDRGQGQRPPARIEVAFVRMLQLAPPPVVAAAAPTPRAAPRRGPAVVEVAPKAPAAASAPTVAVADASALAATPASAPASEPAPEPLRPTPTPAFVPDLVGPPSPTPTLASASTTSAAPQGPLATPANGPLAPPAGLPAASAAMPATATTTQGAASSVYDGWPPSTQLNYRLKGDYRGPLEGWARVEWLRAGSRYQVRVDSTAGLFFSRELVSEGELTDQGLVPRRLSGEQKAFFTSAGAWRLEFGPTEVRLSDGRVAPTVAGVQDEASQFVQLTWLFTRYPERLRVGQSVQLPLALTRKIEPWTFDVVAEESLRFGFGEVATFHVKPRRQPVPGEMTAEMWFAPTLQYLPVRILIRHHEGHWVDLQLDQPPLQAAPEPATGAATGQATKPAAGPAVPAPR